MHAGIVSNGEPGLMSSKASTKYNPRSASGNDDVLDQAGREGTSSVAVSRSGARRQQVAPEPETSNTRA